MKTKLTILFLFLSVSLFATVSDSTAIKKTLHNGPIPDYTPFLTMFYTLDSSGKEQWKMAFSMLVRENETIYFTDAGVSNCGGKNCKNAYRVDVDLASRDPRVNLTIQEWLDENFNGSRVEKMSASYSNYPDEDFELQMFVVDISNKEPKKSRYKLIIGDHPTYKEHPQAVHQGGVVHWPGGN